MANTKESYATQQECLNDLIAHRIVTLEDNTKSLRNNAFYHNSNIKHIKLPRVTSIGNYGVFHYCTNLEDIDFSYPINFYCTSSYSSYSQFIGCPNLAHLILRGSTMSNFTGDNDYIIDGLRGSAIAYKNGAIYVPSNLVNNYKNNEYWGRYFIVPLRDTLLTTFDTIEDDWATIARNCNIGLTDQYEIGDSKVFHDINGNAFYAELVGKDVDQIANGGGRKAATTWITRQLYPNSRTFSASNQPWATSSIRASLNDTENGILSIIDENALINNIKTVDKISYNGTSEVTTQDKIWLPSIREILGTDNYQKNGPDYANSTGDEPGFFLRHRYNRIKFITLDGYTNLTKGNAYYYWTRTSYNSGSSNIVVITSNGAFSYVSRTNSYPYCFGFCI